jgi:hypothetical protein
MNNPVTFNKTMIAPCGINCGTCLAYLRDKNRCYGCLTPDQNTPKSRLYCRIKNCEQLAVTKSKFCFECKLFPCRRLKQLDKRYRTKYHLSLIQNLITLKEIGMTNHLVNEMKKWSCPNCGSTICVHRENCLVCNIDLHKSLNPHTLT